MDGNSADILQTVFSAGSLLIAILGFGLVIYQLRQLRSATQGATHSRLYTEDYEIVKLLIDHPNMRPYFYDNIDPEPGSPDYAATETGAELVSVHFEHIMLQMENLPEHIRTPWQEYIRAIYSSSPVVRRHLDERQSWYSDRLHKLIRQSLPK